MNHHKDLDVWKRSIKLVTEIYKVTETYPKSEIYGLVSQIRRSAVSIPSNIAEGAGRQHKREFRQFLFVSMSSSMELETQLIISTNLGYISEALCENLTNELGNISRMIQGLIKNIKIQEELEERN